MPIEFIPFGDFRPDDLDFETDTLKEAKNVLPLFGSYRLLRGKNIIAAEASDTPVNGAYAHPLLSSESIQLLRPASDDTPNIDTDRWVTLPTEGEDYFEQIKESLPDDSNRVFVGGDRSFASPTDIIFNLAPGEAPGSTSGHILRYRYKLSNTVGDFEFSVALREAGVGGIASKTHINDFATGTTFTFDADASTITDSASGFDTNWKNRWISITGSTNNNGLYLVIDATTSVLTIHPLEGDGPLVDEAAGSDVLLRTQDTIGFVDDSIELTTTEAGNISDHTQLQASVTLLDLGGAEQKAYPSEDITPGNYTTNAGLMEDLFESINEDPSSDVDYIQSPVIGLGETKTYKVALQDLEDPHADDLDHIVRYRYKAVNTGVKLIVYLVQGVGGGEIEIASQSHTSITPGSWTAGSFTLTDAEVALITDFADLYLKFESQFPTAITATEFQKGRPDATIDNTAWRRTDNNEYTNIHTVLDDTTTPGNSDGVIYFYPVAPCVSNEPFEVSLSSLIDPLVHTDHSLYISVTSPFNNNIGYTVRLRQNGNLIKQWSVTGGPVSGGLHENILTLDEADAAKITDYSNLSVWVSSTENCNSGNTPAVHMIELRVPEPRRAQISWAELETPSLARLEMSWMEFELPDPDTTVRADQIELYAGTDTALYQVTSDGFVDVSKSGGYASGSNEPLSWDFTSWGGAIIATNYIDPIQILDVGDAAFSDMITSTDKPKSRFVTAVREFVVLGDISFSGTTDGSPDEVWWSAIDDAASFDVDVTVQCDRQRLRQTPGQITGLVGGEYGIIFKRNSIIRMDYVGYPEIFLFSTLSIRDGTPYSQAIVPVGNDIYFWSSDGLKVLRDGKSIERISDNSVRKFLYDSEFSEHAIGVPGRVSGKEEDGYVFGDYDPTSGLIVWSYRSASDADRMNSKAIVLDTLTGRHTRIEDSSELISAITGRFNVSTEETSLLRGLLCFSWDGSQIKHLKFNSATTYRAQLTTSIRSFENGDQVSIQRIRPIFRGNPVDTTDPRMEVTVKYAKDPLLQTNVSEVTYTKDYQDVHGWYLADLSRSGEFFTIDLQVPPLASQTTKEIDGVQIEYTLDGAY